MRFLLALSLFVTALAFSQGKIIDFNAHYKSWAQQQANKIRRTLMWTDAYGKHKHLAERPQYSQYKVGVEYRNIVYGQTVKDVAKPAFTYEEWIDNGGSRPIIGRFSKTKSMSSSFTWSVTEGLKINTENTFKAGIPGVVGGDLKFKTELALSSTQAKTKTETETFTVENQIPVAPRTSVKVVFTIVEREVEVPWTSDVYIDGSIACWFDPKYNDHWLWFYPVTYLANSDFVRSGDYIKYKAKGNFKGVRGVETYLTTQECDYDMWKRESKCITRKNGLRSSFAVSRPKVIEHKIWHPSV